jgi:hypothetical protein
MKVFYHSINGIAFTSTKSISHEEFKEMLQRAINESKEFQDKGVAAVTLWVEDFTSEEGDEI